MNTMDDLRGTLERHAADLADHDLHVRPVAVRERIRVVRRRRRAVTGAAAAVVVVAATALTASLGGRDAEPQPAGPDRDLAGHVAPATMTSLGYTYAFVTGASGDGRVRLHLDPSESPSLVSWATAGDDDRVTLRVEGEAPRTLEADDFGDFTFVAPRQGGTFTLTGTGEVALAAYDLTDAEVAGDTHAGVTFRDDVAGQRLVGDAIGDPGDAEVDLATDLGAGPLPVSYLCSGGPKGAWVHISINGGGVLGGGGCDDSLFDPAGRGGFSTRLTEAEARDLDLRMWVTDGEHGPLVEDPDLRIGVAAYAPAPTSGRLAGSAVPQLVEYDGHLWRFVDAQANEPGSREVETSGVRGQDTVVVMSFARTGRGTIRSLRDGEPGEMMFAAGGAGSTQAFIPAGDHSAGLRAAGDGIRPDLELGLARYVRAD
ncbi:hypothetical protein ACT8ZV_16500 [Nocardioides sp. MAHUQ-72]|uniref:hypothetical protein n=1 Tax=unclassified Nocardioides TaxID=2615069 RepID=UPI0036073C75